MPISLRRGRSLDSLGHKSENSPQRVSRYDQTLWGTEADQFLNSWRSHPTPQGEHDYTYTKRQTSNSKNEIRLVRLYVAANVNAPLVCDLRVVSLDEKPDYSALSYCWGDPVFDQELICEGKTFLITAQLSAALRQIRLLSPDQRDFWQPLWVDQICIDQRDNRDKAQQVQLMRRIYSQATRVFIQLGDEAEFTEAALDLANKIWTYQEALRQGRAAADANKLIMFWTDETRSQLKGLGELITRPWFRRMWIIQEVATCKHRTFMCGSTSKGAMFFEWELVQSIIMEVGLADYFTIKKIMQVSESRWHETNHSIRNLFSTLQNAINRVENDMPPSFVELLRQSQGFDATDERDKLYALLGLCRDAKDFPDIDYSQVWTQVYQRFANDLVKQGHSTYLLNSAGLRNSSLDLPTWVPDWRNPPYISFYDQLSPFTEGTMKAVNGQTFSVDGETILAIPAAIVTTIRDVAPPMTTQMSPMSIFETVSASTFLIAETLYGAKSKDNSPSTPKLYGPMISKKGTEVMIAFQPAGLGDLSLLLILEGNSYWKYSGKELDYLNKTLDSVQNGQHPTSYEEHSIRTSSAFGAPATFAIGMKQHHGVSTPSTEENVDHGAIETGMKQSLQSFLEADIDKDKGKERVAMEPRVTSDENVEGVLHAPKFEEYWNFAMQNFSHRRVFATENNLVGLGPDLAEPGDLVVLIPGIPVPYVLRPVHVFNENGDKEDTVYQLVGDAYVCGIWKSTQILNVEPVILV